MRRPNILFILADDMGYGDISEFNKGLSKTPALDQLIEQGTILTQHYSCSPVCAPARAGLLTGRYPHRTGAIDTLDMRGLDRVALRETTMAELFKEAGYSTGLIGKWHAGKGEPSYHPNARGFDEFVGFSGGWSNFYDYTLDYNGQMKKSDGTYMTEVFTEEAVQFIRRHHDEPFFLHLTYNAPHWPLQCPEEDVKPFIESGKFSPEVSILYGMIYNMDKGIKRILDELRELGLEEDTMVIFSSDNGPDFDSGGHFWGQPDVSTERFNMGLRGHKYLVYEAGIRVPAIVRWPSGIPGSQVCDHLWHFTDWLPTLLAVAGIEQPSHLKLDGQNLLHLLQGTGESTPTTRFWQWNRYTPQITCNAAMREGEWKLVRPYVEEAMQVLEEDHVLERKAKSSNGGSVAVCLDPLPVIHIEHPHPFQLYNLIEDPFELNDLAKQYPDKVAAMSRQLEQWFESVDKDRNSISR